MSSFQRLSTAALVELEPILTFAGSASGLGRRAGAAACRGRNPRMPCNGEGIPKVCSVVGSTGIEPVTPTMSR